MRSAYMRDDVSVATASSGHALNLSRTESQRTMTSENRTPAPSLLSAAFVEQLPMGQPFALFPAQLVAEARDK
ncbi:hypothetical protein C0992_003245, partial [Termitomyces sp. T32_za158]